MRKTATLCTITLSCAVTAVATGQAILVPNSSPDQIVVLDPNTGDFVTTIDISGFASTPINVIDGPNGTLLLSDQIRDMVFQLDAQGSLVGDYLTAPIDNLRGIHLFDCGVLGGATTNGLFAWDQLGNLLPNSIPGDFFDGLTYGKLLIGADIDDDNVQAYTRDLVLVGESTPGGIDFPEQINLVDGDLLAVAAFSDDAIFFIDLADGSLVSSFPIRGGAGARGVYQLPSGNFLVTDSTNGLDEYAPDGTWLRNILTGTSYRYIEFCANYQP